MYKIKPLIEKLRLAEVGVLFSLLASLPAVAQITPDATLPSNSLVANQGNISIINGGSRAGSNLFHSFNIFSVPTGNTAFFNNAVGIQNIISRVTGGTISNIDGLIRTNGTANLFLLNPNGIVFGPNASLNIGGSFVGSTASAVNFADGTQFSAAAPQSTPLLTISVPIGLQFGANPGGIGVLGDGQGLRQTSKPIDTTAGLNVASTQTLALVGGDVALTGGTLKTAGGRIELGSLAGSSQVSLTPINKGWALGYEGVQNFRDIKLSQQAAVDASGEGGGDVQIQGRQVKVQDGSQIQASTLGAGLGGTLAVKASDLVEIGGTSTDGQSPSGLATGVYPEAKGAGGTLAIDTGSLSVSNGGEVVTSTFGAGNAGSLIVSALDVNLSGTRADGTPSGLFSNVGSIRSSSQAKGTGGNLTINTGRLSVSDGAVVSASTFGAGNAGSLSVNASNVEVRGTPANSNSSGLYGNSSGLFGEVRSSAEGHGANLTINTGRLHVSDGGKVSVSTSGMGSAGNLIINASDVNLSGTAANGNQSGLFSDNDAYLADSSVTGGNLLVNTGRLRVSDGAAVSASTYGDGNGGNLTIHASDAVEVDSDGRIDINVGSISEGHGGNLTINTGRLRVSDRAYVSASTFGDGNAGNLTIHATDTVEVSGGDIDTGANTIGIGNAGDLTIETGRLSVSDYGQVTASTFLGTGNAGNLTIHATDAVEVGRYSLIDTNAATTGIGNAGHLTIQTGRLSVSDGGRVSASAAGLGNAGSLIVNASDVNLSGTAEDGSHSGLYTRVYNRVYNAKGDDGNLTINTGHLSVNDGAYVTASTLGAGNAGNLTIHATGAIEVGRDSDITAQADAGTGNGGDLTIETRSLSVSNGGQVSTSTSGVGNAGNLTIHATDAIEVGRDSGIYAQVNPSATGNAGDLTIGTRSLSVNGGQVSTSTFGTKNAGSLIVNASDVNLSGTRADGNHSGLFSLAAQNSKGNGGNLIINSGRLRVSDGTYVSASTSGAGNAGNLTIHATDTVEVGGDGGIFGQANPSATGNAGDLTIKTRSLSIRDGAQVAVGSQGSGKAGNLEVAAGSIRLDNQGKLQAETVEGIGGNINLQALDLLLLRHSSSISASAGNNQNGGNGGNIDINSNFIVAVPQENSDITANAFKGQGGNVRITTQGIFGTQFRPRQTQQSDITASSEFGVDGVVQINTPGIDPSRGLVNLPVIPLDTSVAQGCTAGGSQAQSEFIITGRGGLPPNPGDALSTDAVQVDLITLNPKVENRSSPTVSTQPTNPQPAPIVPASGWVFNNGQVTLTALAPNVSASIGSNRVPCHAPQQ